MIRSISILTLCLFLSGCATAPRGRAVYVLIDTSGSYIHAVPKAARIVRYLLGTLEPGDTIAVARITSLSFTNKDRVAAITLSRRPAQADSEKRAIAAHIASFVKAMAHRHGTAYTDISGGLLEAAHFLRSIPAGRKEIIVVSDMRQDLPPGAVRHVPIPLVGVTVLAVNVIKSRGENMNPARYLARMHSWEARVKKGGGHFVVVHQLSRLPELLRMS